MLDVEFRCPNPSSSLLSSSMTMTAPRHSTAIASASTVCRMMFSPRASDGSWCKPKGGEGAALLLAQAANDEQRAAIGNQTGGRVGFFLKTDDFARDHAAMIAKGVRFLEQPRHEVYGTVAVFADPYGNTWDLIQHSS